MPQKPRPCPQGEEAGGLKVEWSTRLLEPGPDSDSVRLCLLWKGRTLGSYSFPPQGLLLNRPVHGALPTPASREDRETEVAAVPNSGRAATRGRYRTRGKAVCTPDPRRLNSGLSSRPERKAQTTLYFSNEINSPHTVKIHLCRLHCPRPTGSLVQASAVLGHLERALAAMLLTAELARLPKPGCRVRSLASPPACLCIFHSLAAAKEAIDIPSGGGAGGLLGGGAPGWP